MKLNDDQFLEVVYSALEIFHFIGNASKAGVYSRVKLWTFQSLAAGLNKGEDSNEDKKTPPKRNTLSRGQIIFPLPPSPTKPKPPRSQTIPLHPIFAFDPTSPSPSKRATSGSGYGPAPSAKQQRTVSPSRTPTAVVQPSIYTVDTKGASEYRFEKTVAETKVGRKGAF